MSHIIGVAQPTLVELARELVNASEWKRAYELLAEADAGTPLQGEALALFADVAYAAGRPEVTIGTWERAHAEALRAGDHLAAGAAAVRVAMYLLFDTGLMAPVRAWTRRAERLLDQDRETPAHAWLAVILNYERLLSGDPEGARPWAVRAIEIGTRCDPAAAALGRVAEARNLILGGDVSLGLALLNEVAAAAVSGEIDPLTTGVVYCEVVCALQSLAQFEMAEEWTVAMEGWRKGQPVGSIHGRCRVHRAEILRLRGSCAEAEREALVACDELRPYVGRELGWPLAELGRIRLNRGDLEGAEEAFIGAHEVGWEPHPGLALVHLARGAVGMAVQSIRDSLDHPVSVPSKERPPNTELRRAPLLEAQVEIEIAAGDLDRAAAAANELGRIADSFQSRALEAGAAAVSGRVSLAKGDAAGARLQFQAALEIWTGIGAPYETARARMGLAFAHRAAGNEQLALQELRSARSAFERMGAVRWAAETSRAEWGTGDAASARRSDAEPPGPGWEPGEHVFRREGDHWCLTFAGKTQRLRDLKGIGYVARLLADPGHEFLAFDLVSHAGSRTGGAEDVVLAPGGDAGPLIDLQARTAYRRRLADIDEDIEEARMRGDQEREAQAENERDFLLRELSRAVGLGGRDRYAASSSERARASVTRSIRRALARISEHHPELGAHLERTVQTGTYCVYLPDSGTPGRWVL